MSQSKMFPKAYLDDAKEIFIREAPGHIWEIINNLYKHIGAQAEKIIELEAQIEVLKNPPVVEAPEPPAEEPTQTEELVAEMESIVQPEPELEVAVEPAPEPKKSKKSASSAADTTA